MLTMLKERSWDSNFLYIFQIETQALNLTSILLLETQLSCNNYLHFSTNTKKSTYAFKITCKNIFNTYL